MSRGPCLAEQQTPALGRIVVGGPAARQDVADRLAGLDEVERAFLGTVSSILMDPGMHEFRAMLRRGELALMICDDEVAWKTPEAFAADLVAWAGRRAA